MPILPIGLIGCGRIARGAHAPAFAALTRRVKLVAAADFDIEAARKIAGPWDAEAYSDYRQVLARKDIAAVVVATPEAAHAEQVIAAAAAGKHVLCEKPVASSLAEVDAMIAACERAKVCFLVGHSRRFTNRYIEVNRLVQSGDIGPVRLARENERRNQVFGGDMAKLMWRPGHWTGDPEKCLGVALLAAIHEVDILRWFVAAEPVSVHAEHSVNTEGNIGVPDFLSLTVKFDNGGIGSSELSRMPPDSYPVFHQLELYGERGTIRAKDHECVALTRYASGGADFPGYPDILLHGGPTYVRQLSEFLDAIGEGRPPSVRPRAARAALAMALAAVEAASSGRSVSLGGGR